MASFTDQPHIAFTPYIETNPVDAYLRVGMYKEQQLQEGIAKVQGYVDTITGLPLIKPEDKQYVQDKLNGLKEGISKNLSGDFSDSRITSQIAAGAKQIYTDPIVQNGVAGSMAVKKVNDDIEAAQKAGKSSVENEWDIRNNINKWLTDKTVGSKYSNYFQNYIPYTDVNKKWMDIQKELGAIETTRDLPFLQDAQGNYIDATGKILPPGSAPVLNDVMIEKTFKGKSPQAIKQAIMAGMDENDIRQMGITGRFHYKDLSQDQLKTIADGKQKGYVDQLNNQLKDLATLKSLNPSNASYQEQVDAKIAQVKKDYEASQKAYVSSIDMIATNPDGFKGSLYMTHAVNDFSTAFSNYSDIQKIVNSPYIEKMEKDRTYALAIDKYKLDLSHTKFTENLDIAKYNLDLKKYENTLPGNGISQPGSLDMGAYTDVVKPTATAFIDDLNVQKSIIDQNTTQFKEDYFNSLSNDEFQKQLAFHQEAYNNGKETRAEWIAYFDNNKQLQKSYNQNAALLANIQKDAETKFPEITKLEEKLAKNPLYQKIKRGEKEIATYEEGRDFVLDNAKTLGIPGSPANWTNDIYKKVDGFIQNLMNPGLSSSVITGIQEGVLKPKTDWINQKLADKAINYQPRPFDFNTTTPEKQAFIKAGFNKFLVRIEGEKGKQESFPQTSGFNLDKAKVLLDDPKTKLGYLVQGNQVFLTMQGLSPDNKPLPLQVVATNSSEFQNVFGQSSVSPIQNISNTIMQWGNTNIESGSKYASIKDNPNAYKTAMFGKIRGGSKLDNFPQVNKYNIKADNIALPNGAFQTIFYIETPKTGEWKTYDGAVSTDLNALVGAYQMLDDSAITKILTKK